MMAMYSQDFDHVFETEARALESLKRMDYRAMERVVNLLLAAKANKARVITVGCGTSGQAAKKIAHTCNCVEVPSFFMSPADSVHGGMGAIQEGDIVVLLTKGGNTPEILSFIPVCKQKRAVIIGVTNNRDSTLAKECDIPLIIDSGEEPDAWKLLPCCSTLAAIAVWDAMLIAVMNRSGFTKEEFLLIHPGGATGDKLRTK